MGYAVVQKARCPRLEAVAILVGVRLLGDGARLGSHAVVLHATWSEACMPSCRLRVISSNKDRNIYELRYFNIDNNEGEDEE